MVEAKEVTSRPWELLQVSRETWRRWSQQGLAPKPLPLPGRSRRWLVEEVLRWAKDRGETPA
jgi:predicted DNA-binding transcriptional regulator AlpA